MDAWIDDYCTPAGDAPPVHASLPGLCYEALTFDAGRFHEGAFARHDCPMPPTIARSVAKRQAAFLAGRRCAHGALRRLTGTGHYPAQGDNRAPVWPEGCRGSISHSRDLAVAVAGRTADWAALGVDVEDVLPDAEALPLADAVGTAAELACLRSVTSSAGAAIILALSLKESLFKALHPLCGRLFFCDAAEVTACHADGRATLHLRETLAADWPMDRAVPARFAVSPGRVHTLVALPAEPSTPPG